MAKYSVDGVAKELGIFIKQKRESLSRFAEDEYQLIRRLANHPDNIKFQKELRYEIDAHIGSHVDLAIADATGRTHYADRNFPMERKHIQDIVNSPGGKYDYDVYSCRSPGIRCLATVVPYGAGNRQEGALFISFTPTMLARMLKNSQAPYHRLMLLHRDAPGFVEIAEADTGDAPPDQFGTRALTPEQLANVIYSTSIAGSRWDLVDIPDEQLASGHLVKLRRESFVIFMAFLLINSAIFRVAKNEERKRNKSEKQLAQIKEQLQMALDFSNTGIWELDLTTNIIAVPDNISRGSSGYRIRTLADYLEAVHPDDRERFATAIKNCEETGIAFALEHRVATDDEHLRWFELTGNREHQPEANSNKMIGLMRDISEQKNAERDRMDLLKQQRDALVQEVHHRIKNNLQGVMALLKQYASFHPESRDIFERAASQLHSVSLIHGLHSEMSPGNIFLPDLVMGICQSTSQMTNHMVLPEGIADTRGRATLADDKATLIALILNELIINAVKHGENEKSQPIIVNLVNRENTTAIVEIRNIGRINSPNFCFESRSGLGTGLRLVNILLPRKGAAIKVVQTGQEVIWTLELTAPVIRFRQVAYESGNVTR